MRSPSPAYDYHSEMDEVLARTEALTDEQKAEVELFDSKFTSLLPMQVQYYARKGISLVRKAARSSPLSTTYADRPCTC